MKYSIEIHDDAVPSLLQIVGDYNLAQGTVALAAGRTFAPLTIAEWIDLHIREVAAGPDLAAGIAALQEQAERDVNAAAAALSSRLADALKPAPAQPIE